ncbi:MAG: YciI family protein [Deltaproteobacteria bacterium]|nr:YciI family protein [Deltaproteobacteria bacterium]
MRFLVFLIPGDPQVESGKLPDPRGVAAMMKYNQALANAGVLLGTDGLQPSAKGARIRFAGGRATVSDGPFAAADPIATTYWLWQVNSKQEAVDWASRCPAGDGDVLELRQVSELGLRALRRTSGRRTGRDGRPARPRR